jgi:poly(A) polymerase
VDAPVPQRIKRHRVNPKHLDKNALDVIERLHEHGFDALLVGGCVRDAMCGVIPKDFDVATNATPEDVKSIFRRARLVGRRFPIAHVRYGRDIIEVSTFRQGQLDEVEVDSQGMIIKDHAFGTIAEDAFRRDFTVNALYYDPRTNELIDYVGGVADIEARRLCFIGETKDRLAEDPVRMLRALRFSAKLGFEIDAEILAHADDVAVRLDAIPKARVFDEFLKLFLSGYASPVWDLLRGTPLKRALFPTCDPECELIAAAMRNTDDRIANDQPVTAGFLIAVLLWEDFRARAAELAPNARATGLQDVGFQTLADQQISMSIPRRYGIFAREVWALQDRLVGRNPRSVMRLLHHKRFRAAYDFLTLRAETEPDVREAADWWTSYQEASPEEQHDLVGDLPRTARRPRKRRSRKPRKRAT